MFSLARRALLLTFVAIATLAADVNFNFDIDNSVVAPDGFSRPGVIVNGIFPGTLIQANKNDILHITTNNRLADPTMRRSLTIHWHGLFQMRTASEDGPAFVTQCPIAPNNSYTYDIPLNGQAGTYWYHSHLASQYIDGLRGALVVYDPEDPHRDLYDVDDANTVITLADWYHLPTEGLEQKYLFQGNHHEPIADSGLINGVGRFKGGPQVPWARINVEQGKRYRFRLANISGYGQFNFVIEKHPITIIEVDGVNHNPLTVDSLQILVAQRYSFILNANQTVDNYWIHAPMSEQHDSDNKNLDGNNVRAVLHYVGAPDADPKTNADVNEGKQLQEFMLSPLVNPEAPGGAGPADHIVDVDFDRTTENNELMWRINGQQYQSPDLPTLLNIVVNGFTQQNQFQPSENTIVLNFNETVEVRIHGSANGHTHPFHLHGHASLPSINAFSVVKSIDGPENFVDPPQRDVVGVHGGEVIIRFRADNPGPWFLHCHIDWHLVAGLAVVFAEAPKEQIAGPKAQIIKQEWLDLCPIYQALPPELQ